MEFCTNAPRLRKALRYVACGIGQGKFTRIFCVLYAIKCRDYFTPCGSKRKQNRAVFARETITAPASEA
jgi:hypothetical protein